MAEFSVHDQPDFQRVYDNDEVVEVRRGDLHALLDLVTGSMDFGSCFFDEEQVEVSRKMAVLCGRDPADATPDNFKFKYVCRPRGSHRWNSERHQPYQAKRSCDDCGAASYRDEPPGHIDNMCYGCRGEGTTSYWTVQEIRHITCTTCHGTGVQPN